MIEGINHIGIAVKDLDAVLRTISSLFDCSEVRIFRPMEGLQIALVNLGNVKLEFLELNQIDEGIIDSEKMFLRNISEGIHHVAFNVRDIDDCWRTLKNRKDDSIELINKDPEEGIEGRIGFLSIKESNVWIELIESYS